MSTTAEKAPALIVSGSSRTRLGVRASIALYLEDKEVFCDEVKLWNAKSRERFITRCLQMIDIADDENIRERIDKWLMRQNRRQTYDFYTFT